MPSVANLLTAGIITATAIAFCLTVGSADAKSASKSKPVRIVVKQLVVHPNAVPRTSPVVHRAAAPAGNLNAENSGGIR